MAQYVRFDNLAIQQGDDRPFTWDLTSAQGDPVDLTGYSARAQVRDMSNSSAILHEWSTENGRAQLANSTVALLVDDSDSWTWDHGRYDLRVADSNGNTEVIARGTVVVTAGITR